MLTTRIATAVAAATLTVLTSGASSAAAPGQLPHRAEGMAVHEVGGRWVAPVRGYLGGTWLLFHRGDTVTLQGKGYFLVRWEIEYWRGTGVVSMPTYTDQQGTFLHVGSGGHRMDAPFPGGEAGQTWMGKPSTGYETLPAGTPMIWVNEYYYLDGTVTITCQEAEDGKNGRYNLGIAPKTWQQVESGVRPGVVLDASTVNSPSAAPSASASASARSDTGATGATPVATSPSAVGATTERTPVATGVGQETSLANTGASPLTPVLATAGLALVALGGGVLVLRRRAASAGRGHRRRG